MPWTLNEHRCWLLHFSRVTAACTKKNTPSLDSRVVDSISQFVDSVPLHELSTRNIDGTDVVDVLIHSKP